MLPAAAWKGAQERSQLQGWWQEHWSWSQTAGVPVCVLLSPSSDPWSLVEAGPQLSCVRRGCDVEEITWTSQMRVSYLGDKG